MALGHTFSFRHAGSIGQKRELDGARATSDARPLNEVRVWLYDVRPLCRPAFGFMTWPLGPCFVLDVTLELRLGLYVAFGPAFWVGAYLR